MMAEIGRYGHPGLVPTDLAKAGNFVGAAGFGFDASDDVGHLHRIELSIFRASTIVAGLFDQPRTV